MNRIFNDDLCRHPLYSSRPHRAYDGCLEVRGNIIRTLFCVVLCNKLCTAISILRWAVLTVIWIWFCHTGPISLCVDSFVFYICVFCVFFFWYSTCAVLLQQSEVDRIWLKPNHLNPIFLQCFDTVGWVIWPVETRPRYDYNNVWWNVKPYSTVQARLRPPALTKLGNKWFN